MALAVASRERWTAPLLEARPLRTPRAPRDSSPIARQMLVSLVLLPLAVAFAPLPASSGRLPVANRLTAAPLCLLGGKLPAEIQEFVDPSISTAEVLPLWKEFRACYQSEAAAIAAAKKQPLVILPFFNKAENIRLCWRILSEEIGFSDAERREIVTSYPGVLANKPYELATSSMDEVRFSVRLASAVDSVPEEVRFAVPTVTTLAIVGLIAKRLSDCAGQICG